MRNRRKRSWKSYPEVVRGSLRDFKRLERSSRTRRVGPNSSLMIAFPAPVDAVILDMDGLLLETERVYRRAFIAAAARQGFDMSEDLYQGMVGLADNECFALIQGRFGPQLRMHQYRRELADCLEQFLCAGIPLKPGAVELMDDSRNVGCREYSPHRPIVRRPKTTCVARSFLTASMPL
jgi:beta-phosphoglucomutase-like phosphatase (HAD superfamily)